MNCLQYCDFPPVGQRLIFLPSHLPSCVQQPYHHPHLLLSPERKEAGFIKLMKVTEILRFNKQNWIQAANYSSSTLRQFSPVITCGHLHHWPHYLSLSEFIPFSLCLRSLTQSCLTLCDPMDWNPPGSPVRGILQTRILEQVAIFYSRGSSCPRVQTRISCISSTGRRIRWATREARLCVWPLCFVSLASWAGISFRETSFCLVLD